MMNKIGPWNLKDLATVPKNGLKVFSCFSCGGGSTMGYKLAGFNVLGCCEIDTSLFNMYVKNHKPIYPFNLPVQRLLTENIPDNLFQLDILDGSPPCSSFSMAGQREEKWGSMHHFREGQTEQILDDLFFDFIKIADKLKPKIVIAENVKGLVTGNARGYVKLIFNAFRQAGYETQLFLLNSASMGVPQRRERTFFVARRIDCNLPKINFSFNEAAIKLRDAWSDLKNQHNRSLGPESKKLWERTRPGENFSTVHRNGSMFNHFRLSYDKTPGTLTAVKGLYHPDHPRHLSRLEICRIQTFPDDYDFIDQDPHYVCGMSVPPFMMQRIANEISRQIFKI